MNRRCIRFFGGRVLTVRDATDAWMKKVSETRQLSRSEAPHFASVSHSWGWPPVADGRRKVEIDVAELRPH